MATDSLVSAIKANLEKDDVGGVSVFVTEDLGHRVVTYPKVMLSTSQRPASPTWRN
jgi:hypothetical protein